MDISQARIIDRLRAAAMEHGEVADLLRVVSESLLIDEHGVAIIAGDDGVECLKAAQIASCFADLDREDGK